MAFSGLRWLRLLFGRRLYEECAGRGAVNHLVALESGVSRIPRLDWDFVIICASGDIAQLVRAQHS
jgi:hypothetical protein